MWTKSILCAAAIHTSLPSLLVVQLQAAGSRRHICLADPEGVLQHEGSEQEDQEGIWVFHG